MSTRWCRGGAPSDEAKRPSKSSASYEEAAGQRVGWVASCHASSCVMVGRAEEALLTTKTHPCDRELTTIGAGSPGTILSAVRYGSLEDARKGTAASRAMLATEVARWFEPNAPTIIGTAQRVLEV